MPLILRQRYQGGHALVSYLADLFNHVVRTGFPSTWSFINTSHAFHSTSSQSGFLIDFEQRKVYHQIDRSDRILPGLPFTGSGVPRYTLFFYAPSTTRSERGSIACSENLRPSLDFSDILIRDVWPYIYMRLSSSERILLNLPSGKTLHRGSLHFSQCYLQEGAPSNRLTSV
jgi:hypothetical protein